MKSELYGSQTETYEQICQRFPIGSELEVEGKKLGTVARHAQPETCVEYQTPPFTEPVLEFNYCVIYYVPGIDCEHLITAAQEHPVVGEVLLAAKRQSLADLPL